MAWFKVDDGLHASHKVLSIPRSVRLSAVGLWTLAGAWSADQELDGYIPDFMVTELGGTSRIVGALVKSGLWSEARPDGYQFQKWAEYQPTRADLEAQRAKEAERKRKQRAQHRPESVPVGQDADSGRDTAGSPDTPSRPVPTRPQDSDNTESVSHVSDRARSLGLTDRGIASIRNAVSLHCDIDAADAESVDLAATVLGKSKTAPKSPAAYVRASIETNPSEIDAWFRAHRRHLKAAS